MENPQGLITSRGGVRRAWQGEPRRPARREFGAPDSQGNEFRFRFVLMAIVNAREELWTSAALPVDGFAVRLRRFRKSHHLIPAGPLGLHGSAVGSDASNQRVSACCVRINTFKNKVETACPSSKASSIPGTIRSRWWKTSPPIITGRSSAPAKTK